MLSSLSTWALHLRNGRQPSTARAFGREYGYHKIFVVLVDCQLEFVHLDCSIV